MMRKSSAHGRSGYSRANQSHRSSEWRLYYPTEAGQIQARMHAGDLMVIAVTRERSLVILMAPKGSGRERELQSLFGIAGHSGDRLGVRTFDHAIPAAPLFGSDPVSWARQVAMLAAVTPPRGPSSASEG